MAKVEMDLAELDLIRQDLADAKDQVTSLENVVKSKDVEIATVKADKRTVRIRETLVNKPQKPVYDEYSSYRTATAHNPVNSHVENLAHVVMNLFKNTRRDFPVYHFTQDFNQALRGYGFKHETEIPAFNSDVVTTTEYINFDDVVSELKQKQDQQIASEIDSYKKQISQLQSDKTDFEIKMKQACDTIDKHREISMKGMQEHHEKEIQGLKADYDKLKQEYEDFKLDRKRISLEQRIFDLEKELAYQKSLTWWDKLRGKV